MTDTFKLTPHQQDASDKVKKWYNDKEGLDVNPIFRLFGYAGTGKTTITNSIVRQLGLSLGEDVLFAAYTGKAAMVMRKNQLPASTIHSLIYSVVDPDEKECERLRILLNEPFIDDYERNRIRQELQEVSKPHFQLRTRSGSSLKEAKLLVLDECSMVDAEMLLDLLTFEVPMLVLGDPGQLPPIEGKSPLTDVQPDAMLTEIHRQAADNPIIQLATLARLGKDIELGEYGESRVIQKYELSNTNMQEFDQIIVGKNAMRKRINMRMRQILGYDHKYPVIGEKLICLRNNREIGLLNGMICYVESITGKADKTSIEYLIRRETDGPDDKPIAVRVLRAHFDSYHDDKAMDKVSLKDKFSVNEFDYGYAITVHKAQGSAWDNVCLIDDGMFQGFGKPGDRQKWLYTGITRAAEKITIAY